MNPDINNGNREIVEGCFFEVIPERQDIPRKRMLHALDAKDSLILSEREAKERLQAENFDFYACRVCDLGYDNEGCSCSAERKGYVQGLQKKLTSERALADSLAGALEKIAIGAEPDYLKEVKAGYLMDIARQALNSYNKAREGK